MATGVIDLGQTVGNYRVTAKLGEGSMGAVFLAEHPVIGRLAALKVIHPRHARNPDVLTRFVNEATAINRIGHDHIVEVTDFGRTPDGDFYFIMEYLEGRPLSELIEREAPLSPDRALAIAAQIADALSASHAHGVIHRDLKPENIFLVTRGDDPDFVKVLDFGLAKLVHGDAPAHHTLAGTVMGTPFYMAPEQCQGRSELDARADVYSLGVVLFEMLTGNVPFGGSNYAEVFVKQLSMPVPSVRLLVPDLPDALDVILQRALAKVPGERFETMTAFREALLSPEEHGAKEAPPEVPEELTAPMRAPRSRARVAATVVLVPEGRGAATAFDRVPRTRGAWATAAAVVALVAGIVIAVGVRREHGPPTALTPPPSGPQVVSLPTRPSPEGHDELRTIDDASREPAPPTFSLTRPTPAVAATWRHRPAKGLEHRSHADEIAVHDDGDGVLEPSFLK
jgi:eukaryotic-like serine/threonine-protein kinase